VGNDADLADGLAVRHQLRHQRMAGFVVCNGCSFLLIHHPALFLRTRNYAFDSRLEVRQRNGLGLTTCGHESRLIHSVRQIRPAESGGNASGPFQIEIRCQSYVPAMYLQDLNSADEVWIANGNLAIKASGAEKRGVEYFRTVGSSHDNDWCTRIRLEAIDLR